MTNAKEITHRLEGRWYDNYGLAFCPAHNDKHNPSLSLSDGDSGKLLVYCHAGCPAEDVLRALSSDNVNYNHHKHKTTKDKNLHYIETLWNQGQNAYKSIVETYLRKRYISCDIPSDIRFHPALKHQPTSSYHPAMISLVRNCSGGIEGLQRTYLSSKGTKADIKPNKMMLGNCKGNYVCLSPFNEGMLIICEGIETGLSLVNKHPKAKILVSLSSSGMHNIIQYYPSNSL